MGLFDKKKKVKNTCNNDSPIINAFKNMANMEEIEQAVEGKTIQSLSGNGYGVIIHFTDGTTYTSMGGEVTYDGLKEEKIEMEMELFSNEESYPLEVDDEDEYFTGHAYYSCGNCHHFFGHYNQIPKTRICPKCGKKIKE